MYPSSPYCPFFLLPAMGLAVTFSWARVYTATLSVHSLTRIQTAPGYFQTASCLFDSTLGTIGSATMLKKNSMAKPHLSQAVLECSVPDACKHMKTRHPVQQVRGRKRRAAPPCTTQRWACCSKIDERVICSIPSRGPGIRIQA